MLDISLIKETTLNTQSKPSPRTSARQTLLSLLSKSQRSDIQEAWESTDLRPAYTLLKQPEIGMVMVKAKAGGDGSPFNMGEMTVTRTVLQLTSNELGYGYTAGRDKQKSLTIALVDACYQVDAWKDQIEQKLLKPLQALIRANEAQHKEKVDSTKVNFFTMMRGE